MGVTTAAKGKSSRDKARSASGFNRTAPLVATITGSTTSLVFLRRISRATRRIIPAEKSIPVFAAATGKASKTSRICSATMAGGSAVIRETRPGCSATTQVTAVVPYTP